MNDNLQKLIEKVESGVITGKLGKERVSITVKSTKIISDRQFVLVYVNGDGRHQDFWYDGSEVYESEKDISNNAPYFTKTLRDFRYIVDACFNNPVKGW